MIEENRPQLIAKDVNLMHNILPANYKNIDKGEGKKHSPGSS